MAGLPGIRANQAVTFQACYDFLPHADHQWITPDDEARWCPGVNQHEPPRKAAAAVSKSPIDFIIGEASLRDYLRSNLLDGDEGGRITMPANALLDEIIEVVGMWLHEGFRYSI